jgi:hypothetical protein
VRGDRTGPAGSSGQRDHRASFPEDVKAASLELVAMQPGSYLMLYVLLATALSFAISHMMYLPMYLRSQ